MRDVVVILVPARSGRKQAVRMPMQTVPLTAGGRRGLHGLNALKHVALPSKSRKDPSLLQWLMEESNVTSRHSTIWRGLATRTTVPSTATGLRGCHGLIVPRHAVEASGAGPECEITQVSTGALNVLAIIPRWPCVTLTLAQSIVRFKSGENGAIAHKIAMQGRELASSL